MIKLIQEAISEDLHHLNDENELDRSFYEGRIEALKWVLRQLPEEG